MPTGDPPLCTCVLTVGIGVLLLCPVHRIGTASVFGEPFANPLSQLDVDRIARRVVDMIYERAAADNAARDQSPAFTGSVDELETKLALADFEATG